MGQGGSREQDTVVVGNDENRRVFVRLISYQRTAGAFTTHVIYRYEFRYQRYLWFIEKRFHEIIQLDNALQREFPSVVSSIKRPPSYWLWTPDKAFFDRRAERIADYLQQICDSPDLFDCKRLRLFLELSLVSFSPELGRKSIKEGYLKKSSGGYTEKFSRKMGDYFTYWRWRYFVLHDNCISWFRNPQSATPQGTIQIDRDFHFHAVGRIIVVTTATRRIRLAASSVAEASSWMQAITHFYANTRRRYVQPFMSSSPVRENCDVRVYTYPRDYMASVAVAMLNAQQEIFITSWKNSPTVLLARPPLPPLRLDQLLRYKAEQGVKIYILLYKEVEFAGQGNDSLKAKNYLESLSPNITVLRHPNKILGGSTAVMWSHHEKLVVVDRNMAFVGGIDLAFNRWDDESKSLADEDGLRYPGKDYRQPAEGLFKPVRNPFVTTTGANGQIEIMMVDANSSSLPVAAANVVQMADVYDHDNDIPSPYTSTSNSQVISASGETQGVLSCDFGVMNLDRRTANVVQSRQDGNNSRTVSSAGSQRNIGVGWASSRNIVGDEQGHGTDDASVHGAVSTTIHHTLPEHVRPMRSRGDTVTVLGGDGRHVDAEGRSSMIEERQQQQSKLTSEELAAFAREESDSFMDKETYIGVQPNAVAAASAVALMSEGQDIYGMDQPITASISPSDITVVPTNTSSPRLNRSDTGAGAMSLFFNAATDFVNSVKDAVLDSTKQPQRVILRETHPRMPWHDLHSAVSGGPARDVASHFIQRWNHHRLATGNYDVVALVDTTDDTTFGLCARCGLDKIFELLTHCPRCNYYLGPISAYLDDLRPDLLPETPDSFSYITYECKFPGSILCRFLGDCPVVITQLIPPAREEDFFSEGVLVDESGTMTSELFSLGLIPAVGDVIVAVNGQTVSQLDHVHLDRFIRRQQDLLAESKAPLCVQFRRHYVADNFQGLKQDMMMRTSAAVPVSEQDEIAINSSSSTNMDDEDAKLKAAAASFEDDGAAPAVGPGSECYQPKGYNDSIKGTIKKRTSAIMSDASNKANEVMRSANQAIEGTVNDITKRVDNVSAIAQSAIAAVKGKGEESLTMVCQLTATREIALNISKLYHVPNQIVNLPNRRSDSGTCRVQMLRSVGPWSCGQRIEKSIMTAWAESIMLAERFVYVENQFFIGNLVGQEVQNSVPQAILERVVRAARAGEQFKAIIVIPEHPNGDHVNGSKARIILHYEFQTICRGASSLLEQFRKLVPNVNPAEYIEFFCLRNWGVMNDRFLSDQIYVHDKLLIVDDRFVIVGSANVNDRSMLGDRDSEIAIRFEDSTRIDITLGGTPFEVGFLPHTLRMQLMRQHLGNPTADISDILNPYCYATWRNTAINNTEHYNALLGGTSPHKCRSLTQYSISWRSFNNASMFDSSVYEHAMGIQGHLVFWPLDFLAEEKLAPSLATRAIIPTELWV